MVDQPRQQTSGSLKLVLGRKEGEDWMTMVPAILLAETAEAVFMK